MLCGDRAGFIVNALLFPYLNDAIKMVEANYATADDIDIAMKVVDGMDAAVAHIDTYGTGHTEAIITTDLKAANEFTRRVDVPRPTPLRAITITPFHEGGRHE